MINNLTEKQKKFCEEYVLTGNGAKSALNAGYSDRRCGSMILKSPAVQNEIKRLQKLADEKFLYSRDLCFKNLENIQKMALNHYDTRLTRDGEEIKIPKPDLRTYLKAEELKCKLTGLYEDSKAAEKPVSAKDMGCVKINDDKLNIEVGE